MATVLKDDESPSPNGGRDERGRFVKRNPGGPGNPHGSKTAKLRSALMAAVSERDLKLIVQKLVAKAKAGDSRAIRELLDRLLGKPSQILQTIAAEEKVNVPDVFPLIEVVVESRDDAEQLIRLQDLLPQQPDSIKRMM